jgi:predicted nucleic acid-binding protein
MIVVDASLATKWFLRETESDTALRFLNEHDKILNGPDLLLTEVSGAIVRRANMDKTFGTIALDALREWHSVWATIEAHRINAKSAERASLLAMTLGHPLPDCVYLQLAIELGCDLATCDAKFRNRAIAIHPRVRLLEEYAAKT